jgi:hypothetical protein
VTVAVVDHVAEGLALLIDQYKGRPRLEGMLRSYLEEIQEFEVAAHQVLNGYIVDNAVGAQLDVIGRVVGQKRKGQSDETFRVYLRARIAANRSRGTTNDLLRVLSLATSSPDDGWDPTVEYEIPPRAILVFLDGYGIDLAPAVAELLRDAKLTTLRIDVLAHETPAEVFRWDTGPGWNVGSFAAVIE